MSTEKRKATDISKLRQRAEEALEAPFGGNDSLVDFSQEEMKRLIHELQVHQIELKMQNNELRRIQGELEVTRDRYVHLYNFSPVGYLTLNEKGMIIEANLSCTSMLGIERSSLIGKFFSRFIAKEDQDDFYSYRKTLFESDAKQVCELRLVREDLTQFHAQLDTIIVKNHDGDNVQMRTTITDINELRLAEEALQKAFEGLERQVKERTAQLADRNRELNQEIKERKQAEAKVHKLAERYAVVISGTADGIWDWDLQSNTVFYSDRFKEILGYTSKEFPGTVDAFRSCLHPEDADDVWAAEQSHLKEHIPYNIEYRLKTKSGGYRWFLARGQAIWDDKGNAIRMAGSLQDITERKAAVQSLHDAVIEIKSLKNLLETEKAYLQEEIKQEYNYENIIGNSNELKHTLYKVEQISPTDTAVIILGETGTGKELIARAIHASGSRKNRALVKMNCATLPLTLVESELFGHEKGAFTGATARRLGRFEVADGATLFLDEIGELPLDLQAKLLRVIQDGEFERLGSSKTIKVDVRIISATNRNLEEEVRKGRFREDLWYRLNIFPITVPPLRDRIEDLPLLVDFYVKKLSRRMGKTIEIISDSVMTDLQNYNWPGNIRELENVLERAVIHSSGPKLRLADELKKTSTKFNTNRKTMETVERDHIVQVLEQTRWKVDGKNGASEILGLNRSTLRARMRKLGIQKP
ncbi:MAG: PAS domain S-box protein [Desulfobacula sp.]|nr:PAS domain S-box protein [Desulfobacula sp.]